MLIGEEQVECESSGFTLAGEHHSLGLEAGRRIDWRQSKLSSAEGEQWRGREGWGWACARSPLGPLALTLLRYSRCSRADVGSDRESTAFGLNLS